MDPSAYPYLNFTISTLKVVNLWPKKNLEEADKWRVIKDLSLIISIMPCIIPIMADFIENLCEDNIDVSAIAVNLIAIAPIYTLIYVIGCFIYNRRDIIILMDQISELNKYSMPPDIYEADRSANLYTKMFIIYGILGNIVYAIMPFLNVKHCNQHRTKKWIENGIPCGLITRAFWPMKFDYSPMFEFVFFTQFYVCIMVTIVIMALTMLMCGMLIHTTTHLKHLRKYILNISFTADDCIVAEVHFCVKYHIAIIEFSQGINKTFSSMMLLHVTVTSFIISILGFEILVVDTLSEALRFGWHLGGWVMLLLLVCFYGQSLIDESIGVARDAYFTPWFNSPVSVQKDIKLIIMRAQKPLTLSAANLGIISLPTFLKVMSSAYSYFTLLLKIKS